MINQWKVEETLSPHFPKNGFTIKLLPVFDMKMKQNSSFIEYINTLSLKLLFQMRVPVIYGFTTYTIENAGVQQEQVVILSVFLKVLSIRKDRKSLFSQSQYAFLYQSVSILIDIS